MKKFLSFSLAFVVKSLRRLVYNDDLYGRIMKSKYLNGMTMEAWFILDKKKTHGTSIVWKALTLAFPSCRKLDNLAILKWR